MTTINNSSTARTYSENKELTKQHENKKEEKSFFDELIDDISGLFSNDEPDTKVDEIFKDAEKDIQHIKYKNKTYTISLLEDAEPTMTERWEKDNEKALLSQKENEILKLKQQLRQKDRTIKQQKYKRKEFQTNESTQRPVDTPLYEKKVIPTDRPDETIVLNKEKIFKQKTDTQKIKKREEKLEQAKQDLSDPYDKSLRTKEVGDGNHIDNRSSRPTLNNLKKA